MGLQGFIFLICIAWRKGCKAGKLISGEVKIAQTKEFYLAKPPYCLVHLMAITLRSGVVTITPCDKWRSGLG
jgi:hypothetical protein